MLTALVVVTAAGCSGGGAPAGTSSPDGGSGGLTPLGASLPESVRRAQVLRVGMDISYAPVEFFDPLGGDVLEGAAGSGEPTVIGIDADLANDIGRRLGVRVAFVNTGFDTLLDKLGNGGVDLVMSGMTITDQRLGKAAFLSYFKAGSSILVSRGNPEKINALDDLCGRKVAVQQGTTQEELVNRQRAACAAGGAGLTVQSLDSGTQAILSVKTGNAQAAVADFPVAVYNASLSSNGNDFEVTGKQIEPGDWGIAMRKGPADASLRQAVRSALDAALKDGAYDAVLARWKVQDGAVKVLRLEGQ